MALKRTYPVNSIELLKKPKKIDIEFTSSKYKDNAPTTTKYSTTQTLVPNFVQENLLNSNARVILYNTNTDLVSGTIKYDYYKMIDIIKSNLAQNSNNQFQNVKVINIKQIDNDFISFYIPSYLKLDKILSTLNFETNFSKAFAMDLQNTSFYNKDFLKVRVTILPQKNQSKDNEKMLDEYELGFFRQIICFSFSFIFNLKFAGCACYPQNIDELFLWKSGIYMNCVNAAECNSFLSQNPGAIDPLFVGLCNNAEIISVIQNNINFYTSNEIKIDLNIKNSITHVLNRLVKTFKNQDQNKQV